MTVFVKDRDLARALRRLKVKLKKDMWRRDLARHEEALRPGERRRAKHAKAMKRQRKMAAG